MTIAIYAGSFDPITRGHVNIIERAQGIFSKVIVGIGRNPAKNPLFSLEERINMIREIWGKEDIEVQAFEGLTIDFCKKVGATVMIRGLRAVMDFEFELGIAQANATQNDPNSTVETVFLPSCPEFSFVSSSTVKELARYGGNVEQFVHKCVASRLRQRFSV